MRIVIDLQGAQSSGSRTRGIGRYTMALTRAIVNNRQQHEIIFALNGLFPETIEPIRAAFEGLLPQENIRVWHTAGPVACHDASNHWRRGAAERVREAFLASLKPDAVLITSLFEGYEDDAVTSVGVLSRSVPTAVILYDLIPYIHPSPYLDNPSINAWYQEKIAHFGQCELWLAISESSRQEGIEHLELPSERVVNVSTDADANFQPQRLTEDEEAAVRARYGLNRPFVMYTGGIDHRKNIDGLIRAYAGLPKALRETHQLAIVCSAQPEQVAQLQALAKASGLSEHDLILTGFVPEAHLLALYSLCSLFIFPSWHEGFGLPALEAMRCGAPVIGANTSSLPEVIGWDEALFDPHSCDEMAAIMGRALSDSEFRDALVKNSRHRATLFSWDKSAQQAIEAMERLHATRQHGPCDRACLVHRPKLAYVSPLPPERSGISDYSAELLPALSLHYDIDVIVAQKDVGDSWIREHCGIRSVAWLIDNAHRYERVLYHFGNSAFHQHMFNLLKQVPGVVVLHDFFLSDVLVHMDVHGVSLDQWPRELYASHGYKALCERFQAPDPAEVIWQYPCSLSVIQDSLGLIVHSPHSRHLAEHWFGGESDDWAVIPLLRDHQTDHDRVQARKALGFATGDFVVCSFGMLGPTKLNMSLLEAWLNSDLTRDKACHLVFVGENDGGDYGQTLLARVASASGKSRIHITGWAKGDLFRQYLAAADVGVQLRTQSRGETSAAVLDCMNYGLPTIVNANGAMADLDSEAVWKLPDGFSEEELINALETLREDKACRQRLGQAARNVILERHDPQKCAERYQQAIERFYRQASTGLFALPEAIAKEADTAADGDDLISLAAAMAVNFPSRNRKKQLLVDISVLVQLDAKSGIQRVVRNILREWLLTPPNNFRIEPVYATTDKTYRYAQRFTARFLGLPETLLQDDPMDYASGDIFLGLDLAPPMVVAQSAFFQRLRGQGVRVSFVVYDLLCIRMPRFFVPGVAEIYTAWLDVVAENDGVVCISESVASELQHWLKTSGLERQRPFKVNSFHLGADIEGERSSDSVPSHADAVPVQIKSRPSFLIVGTIEPRKGHAQVLEAFDDLWASGERVNLVIVGKQGWMVESLVKRINSHPELNSRLFWLEGISDEFLEQIYAASTCLIAASYGEGFGLPLIEAAQHKLPIIARDIPVFREVAGEHAYYFDSTDPKGLADAITNWLQRYEKGEHPVSDNMPWLTWKQSAEQLMTILTNDVDRAKTIGDLASAEKPDSELEHQSQVSVQP